MDALFFPETGECLICGRDAEEKLCRKHKEKMQHLWFQKQVPPSNSMQMIMVYSPPKACEFWTVIQKAC